MGFTHCGTVPRCARLKGIPDLVDALQFHYDLENLDEEQFSPDSIAALHH